MNKPTFSELLDRARAGDTVARDALFTQLADADASPLLAMARKALPRGDLARDLVESHDLVQSALRSGWLDLSQFRGGSEVDLYAWMRAILRHKLSRAVRRRRPRLGGDEPVEPVASEGHAEPEPPPEHVIRAEIQRRVREAVDSLPPDQQVVMARRLDGRTAPEIAHELDLDPAAVRKRLSRAMSNLRARLSTEAPPS